MKLFNPARLRRKAVPGLIKHNLDSGKRLVTDRISNCKKERELDPGEGMVVGEGLGQKAISRDLEGVYRGSRPAALTSAASSAGIRPNGPGTAPATARALLPTDR